MEDVREALSSEARIRLTLPTIALALPHGQHMPRCQEHLAPTQRDAMACCQTHLAPLLQSLPKTTNALVAIAADSGEDSNSGIFVACISDDIPRLQRDYGVSVSVMYERCEVHQTSIISNGGASSYFAASGPGSDCSRFLKRQYLHALQQNYNTTKQEVVVRDHMRKTVVVGDHDPTTAAQVKHPWAHLRRLGHELTPLANALEAAGARQVVGADNAWSLRVSSPEALPEVQKEWLRLYSHRKLPRSNRWFTQRPSCVTTLGQNALRAPEFVAMEKDSEAGAMKPQKPWHMSDQDWASWSTSDTGKTKTPQYVLDRYFCSLILRPSDLLQQTLVRRPGFHKLPPSQDELRKKALLHWSVSRKQLQNMQRAWDDCFELSGQSLDFLRVYGPSSDNAAFRVKWQAAYMALDATFAEYLWRIKSNIREPHRVLLSKVADVLEADSNGTPAGPALVSLLADARAQPVLGCNPGAVVVQSW